MKIRIIIIFFLSGLTSCLPFDFDDTDLESYNVYNLGDTLLFQNQQGEQDTFLITEKEIDRLDPSGKIWFRALTATVRFKDLPNNHRAVKIPRFDLTTARKPNDLTHIYWNKNFGIVGYDYKNGEKWIRITSTTMIYWGRSSLKNDTKQIDIITLQRL